MGPVRPGRPLLRALALPLILLALAFQLGAPAAAARMTADLLDPFATVHICSPDAGKRTPPGQHGPVHQHGADCNLCAACTPMLGTTAQAPQPQPSEAVAVIVRSARPESAAPRGPPPRAANARAPPLSA
jgi:hypothetical protein